MRAHARLSASGSSKWLACTPSLLLEEQFEEKSSIYADEGSIAHNVAELKATKYFLKGIGPKKFKAAMDVFEDELKKLAEVAKEQGQELDSFKQMDDYTEDYFDYIKTLSIGFEFNPYVAIEKRVDFSAYAEDGFGTADCIMITGSTIHVIDFKYGKGVSVSAENNSQMMLYALGAYSEYSFLYDIQNVVMHIFQPRKTDGSSSFETDVKTLLEFGELVKEKSQMALKGEGEFNTGEHCRFCKVRQTCRARADANVRLAGFTSLKPPLITNEEVGEYLKLTQDIISWAEDLKSYALAECLAGRDVAGWKAVEGRANRKIMNELEFAEVLITSGFNEAEIYKPKALETLTYLEKLVGKKDFESLGKEFIQKPPGKPTLVQASDKRTAITNVTNAKDVFNEINEEE